MYRCNAYAGSSTLAYNSNLMSPGDRYVTKSCLNLLQSFTVKWKSTTQHNQNEMEASLSLCKHTTQTTDGGRRRRFVERRDTR